jgi:hypothetical protein
MRKIKSLSLLIITSSLVFVYSCKKNTKPVDTETQSVVDNSICEQEFMQIQPTTNNLAIKTKGTSAQRLINGNNSIESFGCDTLTYVSGDTTYTTPSSPPTYQFNYGVCSLASVDGVVRTGSITVRFMGRPNLAGSKTIIKLFNYKVNGAITYSCDSIIVTTVSNSVATKSWNVQIINGVCTGTGWNIKYSSNKNITVSTQSTFALLDDVTTVTGTANGTNRDGKDFTVAINGITKPANCRHITQGTVDVTPKDLSTRTVDFGNGACDDDATFTVNGQTIAFKLK